MITLTKDSSSYSLINSRCGRGCSKTSPRVPYANKSPHETSSCVLATLLSLFQINKFNVDTESINKFLFLEKISALCKDSLKFNYPFPWLKCLLLHFEVIYSY